MVVLFPNHPFVGWKQVKWKLPGEALVVAFLGGNPLVDFQKVSFIISEKMKLTAKLKYAESVAILAF